MIVLASHVFGVSMMCISKSSFCAETLYAVATLPPVLIITCRTRQPSSLQESQERSSPHSRPGRQAMVVCTSHHTTHTTNLGCDPLWARSGRDMAVPHLRSTLLRRGEKDGRLAAMTALHFTSPRSRAGSSRRRSRLLCPRRLCVSRPERCTRG